MYRQRILVCLVWNIFIRVFRGYSLGVKIAPVSPRLKLLWHLKWLWISADEDVRGAIWSSIAKRTAQFICTHTFTRASRRFAPLFFNDFRSYKTQAKILISSCPSHCETTFKWETHGLHTEPATCVEPVAVRPRCTLRTGPGSQADKAMTASKCGMHSHIGPKAQRGMREKEQQIVTIALTCLPWLTSTNISLSDIIMVAKHTITAVSSQSFPSLLWIWLNLSGDEMLF